MYSMQKMSENQVFDGAEYVKCSCGDLLVLHGFGRVHLKNYLEQPYAA